MFDIGICSITKSCQLIPYQSFLSECHGRRIMLIKLEPNMMVNLLQEVSIVI